MFPALKFLTFLQLHYHNKKKKKMWTAKIRCIYFSTHSIDIQGVIHATQILLGNQPLLREMQKDWGQETSMLPNLQNETAFRRRLPGPVSKVRASPAEPVSVGRLHTRLFSTPWKRMRKATQPDTAATFRIHNPWGKLFPSTEHSK